MNSNSEHLKQQAIIALQEGRITKQEYDLYIKSLDAKIESLLPINEINAPVNKPLTQPTQISSTTISSLKSWTKIENTKQQNIIISAIFLFAIVGIVWTLSSSSGLTGFAVLNVGQENYSNNMTINNSQELTSIQISGTMYGEGSATISYNTTNGILHIATINSDLGLPRTNKPSYTAGESITLDHEPTSYTAYLDDGINTIAVTLPLQAPDTNATLLLVVNESDNITTYKIPIIIGNFERTTTFEKLCDQTCQMNSATGNIIIETTGDTSVKFNKIETTLAKNTAPLYAITINPITINETTTIDLNSHFTDIDSDTLYYSTSTSSIANLSIENNMLTITPTTNGEETITIYSSDLKEITEVKFTLTVNKIRTPEQEMPQEINSTTNMMNETTNILNNTENITDNTSQNENMTNNTLDISNYTQISDSTVNTSLDCSNSNPNERPIACLQDNASTYFKDEDKYWEDISRNKVAKFNVLGNMLITGNVIEHSTAKPSSNDFILGYQDADENIIGKIWIDSQGNLQLTGTLHEEQIQLNPPPMTYSLMTRRSIFIAYADTNSGDLYLRGNLIPYRRSVE